MRLPALAVAAMLPLTAGCGVAYNMGYTHDPKPWPPERPAQSRPSVSVYCNTWGGPATPGQAAQLPCVDVYVQELEASKLFSKVFNGTAGGDLRLNVQGERFDPTFDIGNVLGFYLTVGLVPWVWHSDWNMVVEVYDARGAKRGGVIEVEQARFLWALWSLPAKGPGFTVGPLLRASLKELEHQGALENPS